MCQKFLHMDEAAYTLKAIAHETRLCVISLLSTQQELTVSDIGQQLGCEQSLLSHHLTDMRAKGILHCRREGKHCFYSIKNRHIIQLLECIRQCACNNNEPK